MLECIACPPVLLQLVISIHEDMNARIQFDGNTSDSFKVICGVKEGHVLALTLFAVYFAALLHRAFGSNEDGVYFSTIFGGSLFNLQRLKSKRLTTEVLIRELFFADDTAIVDHSKVALQGLIARLGEACDLFKLTISVQKTVVGQGTNSPPEI